MSHCGSSVQNRVSEGEKTHQEKKQGGREDMGCLMEEGGESYRISLTMHDGSRLSKEGVWGGNCGVKGREGTSGGSDDQLSGGA